MKASAQRGWAMAVGVVGTIVASAALSGAQACSLPPPERYEPCETLRLHTPAPTFPLALRSAPTTGTHRVRLVLKIGDGTEVLSDEV